LGFFGWFWWVDPDGGRDLRRFWWFVYEAFGRIDDVLQGHHFRSGEDLNATMHRYVLLYNQHLPQSVLQSRTPLQAMKDRNKLKPELFKKNLYYLTGCEN
jgi:hypothetical protein